MNPSQTTRRLPTKKVKHTQDGKKLISVYCTTETHEEMRKMATKEHRSLSSWLTIAAIEKLERMGKNK